MKKVKSEQQHTPTPWKHSGTEIVTDYTGPGGKVIAIAAHGTNVKRSAA